MQSSAVPSPVETDDRAAAVPSGRAIDLVHLARQSLGDKSLEIELLSLFERQAETILTRLMQPASNGDRRWQMDLAHTLKGSARAVGAVRVAHAAHEHEVLLGGACSGGDLANSVARLETSVREAQSLIRDLIAGA